jgi:DNA-directed RNA polymerase subunit beta'
MSKAYEKAGIHSIRIRTALPCEVQDRVCAVCYGAIWRRGTPVNIVEAVVVIAAQSIGEAGNPAPSMRTFTSAGTAQVFDQSFSTSSTTARSDPQPQRGEEFDGS